VRIAIYTSITGGKDSLKDPPSQDDVDQVLFTDHAVNHAWAVRPACQLFADPRRNSRAHKILAHQYLHGYDYSLWIDGSIRLLASARALVATYLHDADVALFRHPERDCLYAEAAICADAGHDDVGTLAEQVAKYRGAGHPEHAGLNECAVILRRHNARTAAFNDAWWAEYCRHSCRDQVSVNYVLRVLGVHVAALPGSIRGDNPGIVRYEGHLK
jgi:hypothetical protein